MNSEGDNKGNNYNMYNPYGGMYQQNQGFNMQQDPNMVYQQNQGFNMQQDPNMMYQQNYHMDQQNMNNNPYNQQFQQNFLNQNTPVQNTQNIPAKTVPKGIAGLPGVKTANNNKPQGQTTNKATNPPLKTGDNKTQVNKPGTANTSKKPEVKVQAGKKEEIKPAVKKVEEKKVEISNVEDLSKNIEDINLDPEQILVDDSKEGSMIEVDTVRKPVNVIFIGHVDAGKSTISGNILYKSGMIDERTIEKYQRLAKANNRESWFIAYITDENEEERERGKTVEVGKAFFNTPTKRYTILDAPGHAGYVPNMLLGACQADFAGLVISAKMGEFEAGFEGEGRTREHALLAKSLGITKLIVIINKMDEDTVRWSKERYDQIKTDLSYFLKMCGYNIEKHVSWIPISGLKGDNLVTKVDKHVCPWYEGPTLIELLDSLETPERKEDAPVRIPVLDRYKDQGVYLLGKIESGIVKYGATYTIMPSKFTFEVGWLFNTEDKGVPYAKPGECIRIKVKGLENETDIQRGNIICSPEDLCPVFNCFEAEMQILDIPSGKKGIMANGYQCIIHMHTIIEEISIEILAEIDRKTKVEKKVKFLRSQTRARVLIKTTNPICGEKFDKFATLGRFTLRDEGKTIAIGKVLRYKSTLAK